MPTKISQLAEYNLLTASAFIPIVDNNETVGDKNKKISIADLRKVFYLNSRNTSSFIRHTPGLYYFGDNSDGPGNFSGSITTLRTRISASFSSSLDGVPVVKNFSSLFVSRSVVISPPSRCRGMLIFVDGDATISGSLSMTARGAKFTGSDASFTTINPPYLGDYWSTQLFPSSSYLSRVFAVGASGGPAGGATSAGGTGGTGTLGRSGGGGGGGGSGPNGGGVGAAGTSFSGGSGGGGGGPTPGGSANGFGGRGGIGSTFGAGGAGNPGGTSPNGNAGATGTGGLLILIVRGNLKIGPNGSIVTNGSAGGNFAGSPSQSGGGGGSGGGVIYVYYGGTLTNNGTITSNGGSGGTAGPTNSYAGGAGGAGTSIIQKLNTAFPAAN